MAATDRKHGKYGQIKADPAGGVATVVLASLDKWDLDLSKDRQKTTSFEDTNQTYVEGHPDIKGTFSGNYDSSAEGLVLFDIIGGSVAPFLELLPDRNEPTIKFSGHGLLDGKITVDANGKVSVGGSFVAADSWTIPNSSLA